MEKIRKGDEVVVITGKDKGKRGTVSVRLDAEHVVVEGLNRAKKHVRPNPVKGVAGVFTPIKSNRLSRLCVRIFRKLPKRPRFYWGLKWHTGGQPNMLASYMIALLIAITGSFC